MAIMTRSGFNALLRTELAGVYLGTYKERPLEYPFFLNVSDMETNPEKYQQVSGLGTALEMGEGDTFPLDEAVLGGEKSYEVTNKGKAIEITYRLWRDEKYGVMRDMVAELARGMRNKQEVDGWSILNNAFDNAFPGFDGVSLCNTAHPAYAPGGVSRANRPAIDIGFGVTALQNAIIRFEDQVNDRGLPMLLSPSKILLSTANRFLAREILGSGGRPFTPDNEINALIQDDLSYMVCHYFTERSQWFVTAAKGVHDLNFKWRDRPMFDGFDDPWTKNAIYTAFMAYDVGFASDRGIDGSKAAA